MLRKGTIMIQINQIKLPFGHSEEMLKAAITKKLKGTKNFTYEILKKSIDARNEKQILQVYSVLVCIDGEEKIIQKVNDKNIMLTNEKKYHFLPSGTQKLQGPIVIVGMGPAGLFCAYMLACHGYQPIVIERGESIRERSKTVEMFWENGKLNPESNVQFGEGGAGTFSDGKLNTAVKDRFGRIKFVLETLVKFGANPEICYESKPHIGTDVLKTVVENMRNELIRLGGEVRFCSKLTDIVWENEHKMRIQISDTKAKKEPYWLDAGVLVLALGHSARDTFFMLHQKQLKIEQKAFAVGVRVEHKQTKMNLSQYKTDDERLPAASYKVAAKAKNGRNVYSFCMCPGGYVVNASSEEGRLAINGMSYHKRDGENANSAIIVNVTPDDFGSSSPLAGVEFQRRLEERAFLAGGGKIPVQMLGDYKEKRISTTVHSIQPNMKGAYCLADLNPIFPDYINEAIVDGMEQFGRKIKGFDHPDTILSGVESRTSSPVRILRDEKLESNKANLYPCGEGAGYAGGITSAAVDGIKVFEAIASKFALRI